MCDESPRIGYGRRIERTPWHRPFRALLALVLLLGSCRPDGGGAPEAPAPLPAEGEASRRALEREVRAAARRGIEYLLAKAPSMTGEWGVSTFSILYRIAPDDAVAARARAALDAALAKTQAELPARLDDPQLLEPERLRAVLGELWRRKLGGGSWAGETAALGALVRENEERLWQSMPVGRQLVYLHYLHRLGIPTLLRVDDVKWELRWVWGVRDRAALLRDAAFMYSVTHVFYTGSGYFQTRLDPERYPNEIELFDRALESYARDFPSDSNFVDISGEILASRKLMGLPDTDASRALVRALLARQNDDGSWLVPRGFQDIHATASVVHGFLDYPAELRSLGP